jgi:carbon storage regulator
MLVLTRKPGEAIRIGEDVEIHVLEIRGETVKIGIDAPRSLPVWRRELYDEIVRENRGAAALPLDPKRIDHLIRRVAVPSDRTEK